MKKTICFCLLFCLFLPSVLRAQSDSSSVMLEQISLNRGKFLIEIQGLGIGLGGIFRSKNPYGIQFGFSAGVGIDLTNLILISGSSYTPSYGLSYEEKLREEGGWYAELLYLKVFLHRKVKKGFRFDLGWRLALFLHDDRISNNLGGGAANGVYFYPHWGKGGLKIGPRIFAGSLNDGGPREFAFMVAPIELRIALGGKKKR
ncbi:MAG: hypothetical protein AAFV25_14805 [Bacteroidota bacterium]